MVHGRLSIGWSGVDRLVLSRLCVSRPEKAFSIGTKASETGRSWRIFQPWLCIFSQVLLTIKSPGVDQLMLVAKAYRASCLYEALSGRRRAETPIARWSDRKSVVPISEQATQKRDQLALLVGVGL